MTKAEVQEKKDSDVAIRDAFVHTVCFPFS